MNFTITEPAEDRSLLSEDELRAAIGGDGTASSDAITALGARVSSAIVRACNVRADGAVPPTLRQETVTVTYRLKCHQECLILPRKPVAEITSIVENGATLGDDAYDVNAAAGLIKRLSGDVETKWPSGKIVIVAECGWDTVPDDMKLAAAKLAALVWSEGERVDPNLKRVNIPGVEEREYWVAPNLDALLPQEILDLLSPYINRVVG